MKHIPLTQGKFALVDDKDYEWLMQWKWCYAKGKTSSCVQRKEWPMTSCKHRTIRMHRLIMDAPKGMQVDHINHNTLDNRRCNLRIVTPQQNLYNTRARPNATSRYKGVHWRKDIKKWRVTISLNIRRTIGYFHSEIEAAKAYDKAAKELFGEFAYLNFP